MKIKENNFASTKKRNSKKLEASTNNVINKKIIDSLNNCFNDFEVEIENLLKFINES